MTSAQLDARRSRAKKQKADPLPAFSSQLPAGRSPRGFTLLEVMVALCILAIVLLSVYRLHSQTISMSIESRFYTQAPLLARSALARWEEARKPEMISDQGDFGREFPGYQWKISVEEAPSPALGAQFARDMQRINVLVTLNNGEHSYEFRTYRFVRE
jgi:prepilin-type N-terminal cleavage/methylation domain-containing protein